MGRRRKGPRTAIEIDRRFFEAAVALCLVTCPWLRPAAAESAPCSTGEAGTATVAAIDEQGDIILKDGRTLRLPSLEFPFFGRRSTRVQARAQLTRWLVGRAVAVAPVGMGPDRWGRFIARVRIKDSSGLDEWVDERMLAHGFARVVPRGAPACLAQFLRIEGEARKAKMGLWTDPYYAVIFGDDRRALLRHVGELVLVEGRIVSVGHEYGRVFANFGRSKRRDLAFVATDKSLKKFAAAGTPLEFRPGTFVQGRGFLDWSYGPQIEIENREQAQTTAVGGRPSDGLAKTP